MNGGIPTSCCKRYLEVSPISGSAEACAFARAVHEQLGALLKKNGGTEYAVVLLCSAGLRDFSRTWKLVDCDGRRSEPAAERQTDALFRQDRSAARRSPRHEFLSSAALERGRAVLHRESELQALRICYASLTPREREVMALVVSGLLNKQAPANSASARSPSRRTAAR